MSLELAVDEAFPRQLLGGMAVGLAVGWAGAGLLRRVPTPATSVVPVVGLAVVLARRLAEVPLPAGVRIGVVARDGEVLVPGGATRLDAGDRLVVMAVHRPDLADAVGRWAGTARA